MARILVVDDDSTSRLVLGEILKSGGHTVEEAADGNEAIKKFRLNRADLIITDIFMPEKEGLETIHELKRDFPEIRIIAVSGGSSFTAFECLKWAQSYGADKTLTKPFNRDEILASVASLLENR